jgi:hypothetical protein
MDFLHDPFDVGEGVDVIAMGMVCPRRERRERNRTNDAKRYSEPHAQAS